MAIFEKQNTVNMKRFAILVLLALSSVMATAQSMFVSLLPCPEKSGATVMGVVECDGKPLPGVLVSDGYEIVSTDQNGCYYINSEKTNGQVFVTSPSGYEYQMHRYGMPEFWAQLYATKDRIERHDFSLIRRDNDKHVMICVADIQIGNRYDDIDQFLSNTMPVIRQTVKKFGKEPVYSLNAGDLAYDRYWYSNQSPIERFPGLLERAKWPVPMFACMGNHDHDAATPSTENTHFDAQNRYRKTMGPTYYSFNVGQLHYIVVANIYYLNEPYEEGQPNPHPGTVGRVNYHHMYSPEQLEWLKKDLEHVDRSTPLVILMHDPMFKYKKTSTTEFVNNFADKENHSAFLSLLEGYEVHIVSGHSHRHTTVRVPERNLIDHNVGSICGNMWQTGGFGYELVGFDGAPAGFEIIEVDGKNMRWKFRGISTKENEQCRMWDMNGVREYCRKDAMYAEFMTHFPKRHDLRKGMENQVYLQVWGWEPKWTVKAWEDGRPVQAVRKPLENPQVELTDAILPHMKQNRFTKSVAKPRYQYTTFLIQCSGPKSTVKVELTDAFGEKYTQTLKRPAPFVLTKR